MSKNYLTKEKYEELLNELNYLKTEGRKEIGEKLRQAKELGDLRENAEYQSVKEEQAALEQRILELENILQNSSLIEEAKSKRTISLGSLVTLLKNNKEKVSYKLVGSNEVNPSQGLISNVSPLGKLLINKKEGDVVELETKDGKKIEYKILKIE